MEEQTIKGRLAIGAISDESGKERVFKFLKKTFPKAPSKTLAALISNPKASLMLTLKKKQATQFIKILNTIGARARFVPLAGQSKTPQPDANINMNQVKAVIMRGFQGKIEKASLPILYRGGLALTAMFMLLLPLIYLLLIVGIGYLLCVHIQENISFFNTINSGKVALFAYVSPIIIGALLLLFMVKPIFARRQFQAHARPLDPQKELFLYTYVRKVAEMLGAPAPTNIYTVMEVNASASFKSGFKGFFANELELTIGLPLAAGMNLHQLTEVIGHELGHFAQTAGMRFSYIIRRTNRWFARVVYEKDKWDVRIKRWSQEWDFRISIILYLARFFIWLTRKLLWALMWVGEAVSCFMMRQMEYDADRHGLALIGAKVFQSSSERLEILSWAHDWANDDLNSAWEEGRLVDDLPALIQSRANQIPQAKKQEFLQTVISDKTRRLFDTHPSTAERIAHAHQHDKPPKFSIDTANPDMQSYLAKAQSNDPGNIYQLSPPSAVLFSDFPVTCKNRTREYYEMVLGEPVPERRLISSKKLIKSNEKEVKSQEALEQVFVGQFNIYREPERFTLPIEAPENADACKIKIKTLKAELEQLKKDYAAAHGTYSKIDDRIRLLHQASALHNAGFPIDPKGFSLIRADRETIEQTQSNAAAEGKKLLNRMRNFESVAFERMNHTLSLLAQSTVNEHIPKASELKSTSEGYIESWNTLADAHADFTAMESLYQKLMILADQLEEEGNDQRFINEIQKLMADGYHMLHDTKKRFSNLDYPFDHADEDILLGHFLVGVVPPADHLGPLLDTMEDCIRAYFSLLGRLAANLAFNIVRIEKALNIE